MAAPNPNLCEAGTPRLRPGSRAAYLIASVTASRRLQFATRCYARHWRQQPVFITAHPDRRRPPANYAPPLSAQQIATFQQWIREGYPP